MSTANSVILQLQNDLQEANSTTGASDTTIHDAILTLISGYGSGNTNIKHTGTITYNANYSHVEHQCNSSKYFIIIKATGTLPESTDDIWRAINVIGMYDSNGMPFNNSTYTNISAGSRYKDGTFSTVVWAGNNSTENKFDFTGNSLLQGIEYQWELYDLTNFCTSSVDTVTINEINDMVVEYFENKTVLEVEL